jgi:hypothetical protein
MKCNFIFPPPQIYGCGEKDVPVFAAILTTLWEEGKGLRNDCTNFSNFFIRYMNMENVVSDTAICTGNV